METIKNSLIKIAAISFLLIIFWSASAYAQPNITGLSGSLVHKGTLTITGTGFGTKATPAPLKWDDFESGALGANLGNGWWSTAVGGSGPLPKYDNTVLRTGSTMSVLQDYTYPGVGSTGGNRQYGAAFGLVNQNNNKYYVSFWRYLTTAGSPVRNFKTFSLRGGSAGAWDNPEARMDTYAIYGNSYGYFYTTDCSGATSATKDGQYFSHATGIWMRFEFYIDTGTIGGTDGIYWHARDGIERVRLSNQVMRTSSCAFSNLYINGYFSRESGDNDASAYIWNDDVYIDTTQARVEMGNAPAWAASTHREIQIPSAWSNDGTSITITLNQGSFANFNNVYLYVIDANGNVNENGYLLSDGGGGTTPPPPSSGSGGDSGGGSGGGSGCGFVKDDGKGQGAKGEGLSMILLFLLLILLKLKNKQNFLGGLFIMMNTKKSLPILLSFSLAVLLFSYPAISEAATYYVSNSGSATWAQCTNINTPCDVQTAFNNAVAGDIVYFRGGTYNVPAKNFGSTYHGYYEPANSGTSGNLITFAAYSGETPIFNGTAGGTGDVPELATIFGTFGRSYIVFDGFTLQADNGTKMARVHIGSDDSNVVSTGITVKNCVFNGGSTVITSTDNREGLRVDYVSGLTAQRNRLYNYRQTSNWHNTSAVKMYHDTNIIFENNEIFNCSAGLYYKSDVITAVTRYNYIHDCYLGIFSNAWAAGYNMDGHTYSHNVISNCSYSAMHLLAEGGTFNNLTVNNNTIYNSSVSGDLYGIAIAANANYNASNSQTVHSNIILGTTYKLTFAQGTISESQYNQYGNAGSFNVRTHYGAGAVTYTSLTAWHNSTEVDGGVHPEGATTLNGLASDPIFQNGSGTMNQLNDFRLANNSPSKGTGKGGVDMGADIDSVGTGGIGGGDIPPPSDGGNTPPSSDSGGDSGGGSGGGGCGFVKNDAKGQGAKGEGLSMMILLVLALTAIFSLRKIKYFKGLLFLIMFLFPFSIANAATYYVDQNNTAASDSNTGTETLPWKTIQKAANTMVAGDTVLIKEGVYFKDGTGSSIGGQDTGGIQPKNSGSSGSPITFKAYPGHKVIIDQNYESMGFFIYQKDYITIDGLEIRNCWWAGIRTASDTSNLQGLLIQNNKIHDISGPSNENAGAIRPDGAVGAVIRNNQLYNINNSSQNATGIHAYDLWNSTVENNEIWNAEQGIFYKRQYNDQGNITRYNYIHDVTIGIRFNSTGPPFYACTNHTVNNNIIYKAAQMAISMWECDDGVSQNNKFIIILL